MDFSLLMFNQRDALTDSYGTQYTEGFIQSLCCKLRNDVCALNSISASSLTEGASSAVCVSNIAPKDKTTKSEVNDSRICICECNVNLKVHKKPDTATMIDSLLLSGALL